MQGGRYNYLQITHWGWDVPHVDGDECASSKFRLFSRAAKSRLFGTRQLSPRETDPYQMHLIKSKDVIETPRMVRGVDVGGYGQKMNTFLAESVSTAVQNQRSTCRTQR